MLLLGLDIGSSSVKASVMDGETGNTLAAAFYPKQEMAIEAPQAGWAEQSPLRWWECVKSVLAEINGSGNYDPRDIGAIGISYQMHGLVLLDKNGEVLRPSIIWCDSRAVDIGQQAFEAIGAQTALQHLLNSPGNFTASKLKWVKENEPDIYDRVETLMLPGDYIAYKLTGEKQTTVSGLSEGILWDFKEDKLADLVLDHYGLDPGFIPEIVPSFSVQGRLTHAVSAELGLKTGIPVSYRAGDQPNNALSLNVLEPGEIAATAGTSGVVYGVSDTVKYDPQSRVNTFAHVNHGPKTRLGILLCINGTGILNSWLKRLIGEGLTYEEMNQRAASVPIGSDGLVVLPFGNGAERVLCNADPGCRFEGIQFNRHGNPHIFRAAQEGIVFSFKYGMDIMTDMGIDPSVIRAGKSNMFLSPVFCDTLAGITGLPIELYNTDGAQGAARGAGVGVGYYATLKEAFTGLNILDRIDPNPQNIHALQSAYQKWEDVLNP